MKRPTDITARVWLAVRRIEARGERPTNHGVRAELLELYGAGGSFREVSPVVEAWRVEQVTKAERRIDAAVAALAKLEQPVEVEEVARRFRAKHGGEIRLSIHRQSKKSA
jgi:hypothetical protein